MTAGCCLRLRSSVLNLTSDVVAVQQWLHVADLLQQSSLGKKEVLLCAEKHNSKTCVLQIMDTDNIHSSCLLVLTSQDEL